MKSSKFATALFAFSGLVFLASAGHAAYQDLKPAPVSIQLTDEEKKLVDGATFEMSYSTDDLTSSKGAEYALLDGNVKRVGFGDNAYSFQTKKRLADFSITERPNYDNLVAFKGYDLLYGMTYNFQSATDTKVNFSIVNKETKKVTAATIPISKELRGDKNPLITDVAFYRKGNTVYGVVQIPEYENRGSKAPSYFFITFSVNLETGATTPAKRVNLPEEFASIAWGEAKSSRVYDPQVLLYKSMYARDEKFRLMTFDAETEKFTEITPEQGMSATHSILYTVGDKTYIALADEVPAFTGADTYVKASERKNNETKYYVLGAGSQKLEEAFTTETDVYAPQVYLNKGNLVMVTLVDGKPTLRVQSMQTKEILLSKTIDVNDDVFFIDTRRYGMMRMK